MDSYSFTPEQLAIYEAVIAQDADIDTNGDGQLSRDEFNNSVLTRLTTDTDGSLYGNS